MYIKPTHLIALDWAIRCFGHDHVHNKALRSVRVAEEAVELAQACDVPKETLHRLIDIVYERPVGNPKQEMGGLLLTMIVMSAAHFGCHPEVFFELELRRVLAKPPEHFAKRNQEKLDLGLNA